MTYHVYPTGDHIEHTTNGDDCICGPHTEAVPTTNGTIGWLITHHSLDAREHTE